MTDLHEIVRRLNAKKYVETLSDTCEECGAPATVNTTDTYEVLPFAHGEENYARLFKCADSHSYCTDCYIPPTNRELPAKQLAQYVLKLWADPVADADYIEKVDSINGITRTVEVVHRVEMSPEQLAEVKELHLEHLRRTNA